MKNIDLMFQEYARLSRIFVKLEQELWPILEAMNGEYTDSEGTRYHLDKKNPTTMHITYKASTFNKDEEVPNAGM